MYETLILSVLIHTLLHPTRTRLYIHTHMRTRKQYIHTKHRNTLDQLSPSLFPPPSLSHTRKITLKLTHMRTHKYMDTKKMERTVQRGLQEYYEALMDEITEACRLRLVQMEQVLRQV